MTKIGTSPMQVMAANSNSMIAPASQITAADVTAQLRAGDARIRADAAQVQAMALAKGQHVSTQVHYSTGPDGRNYVSAITVTRTGRVPLGESLDGARAQEFSDISPMRLSLSPRDMAEAFNDTGGDSKGFTAWLRERAYALSESVAMQALRDADIGVRTHEGLHFRVAGGLAAGTPELEYLQGPDGQYYAVAGQVQVQTTSTGDAEKASRDAATYARAAMAPGDASAHDMHAARGAYSHAADAYGKALAGRGLPQADVNLIA